MTLKMHGFFSQIMGYGESYGFFEKNFSANEHGAGLWGLTAME